MPKTQLVRKKRFLLDDKEKLKNKWFGSKGELLTLTYDYSPLMSEDLEYKAFIEVAVENFNRLGLARLVYQPLEMGTYLKDCPREIEYLKFKYKNHVVFSYYKPRHDEDKMVCQVSFKHFYNDNIDEFAYLFAPEDNTTLPPFAEMACNTKHRRFSQIALGVIQHEFNHFFGIRHAHSIENTNGIFPTVKPKPELTQINKDSDISFATFLEVYGYSDTYPVDNYTLISPFSIQHYAEDIYKKYRAFNRTRMSELLDSYKVENIKPNYFYLLDKYLGKYVVYTYQDILALASAVYSISPDSLTDRRFNFPNYYFVDGVYLPKEDKLKFIELIDTLNRVENFSYPFLWQENVTLTLQKDEFFAKNLLEELKIVSLSNHSLSCSFQEETTPNLAKYFSVDSDCFIRGMLGAAGEYDVPIIFRQHKNELKYKLRLLVEEKIRNKVFLAKKQTNFSMQTGSESFYVDLVDVCQAVAYPVERRLSCGLMQSDLLDYTPVQHCMFLVQESINHNLSFIFLNGEANKTCFIAFLLDGTSGLESSTSLDNLSIRKSREAPFSSASTDKTRQSDALEKRWMQITYSFTIPLYQGVIEGVIDSSYLHAYTKSGLKLLPRVTLWYLGYFDPKHFLLMLFASFFEGTIKNNFKYKVSDITEKLINTALFLGMTELEYGFSNLWLLADQPQFWPAVTDKFNQLFVQLCYAPMMKTLGYMSTVSLISCCAAAIPEVQKGKAKSAAPLLTSEHENTLGQSVPMKSSFVAAMQDACQTVFSRKTFKLFSFFKVNSNQAREVSSSEEISMTPTPA